LIFDLSSNLREGLQRKSFFEARKKDCSGKPDPKGHAIKKIISRKGEGKTYLLLSIPNPEVSGRIECSTFPESSGGC